MGKEADLLKCVKENNRIKLQKLLFPEKGFSVKKANLKDDPPIPGGRVRMSIKHLNINCHEDGTGYTPLIIAVLNGNREIVEDLIFHTADISAQDSKGNTALQMAVFGDKLEMVEILINNYAKVNVQNSDGNTALHICSQSNQHTHVVRIMDKLLQAGAATDLENNNGEMPLDLAAMFNNKECVSLLLDQDEKLRKNTHAIVQASIRGNNDIVELLLDYGVDPNAVDPKMQTGPMHEAVRFHRYTVVETLLKYGGKPDIYNGKIESPQGIAKPFPAEVRDKFYGMFEEYKKSGPTRKPRLLQLARTPSQQKQPEYPPLPNNPCWTKNDDKYCNSCTEHAPNTNILDDDPHTCWIASDIHGAWTVLDLQHSHTICGIIIYGWDSPQMLKQFEIQAGESLRGPWTTVGTFTCRRLGETALNSKGVPQTFTGFSGSSQFWRLLIRSSHGGNCICFQGIQLLGSEDRIHDLLAEFNLEHYEEAITLKGVNTLKKFLFPKAEEILFDILKEKEKVTALLEVAEKYRSSVFLLTHLKWEVTPVTGGTEGEIIPDFTVKADVGVREEVEVMATGCVLIGKTRIELVPGPGEDDPSTATFIAVKINAPGKHKLVVRGVTHPEVVLQSPGEIDIKPKTALRGSVAMAFDDMEAMLRDLQASLDPVEQG